MGLDDNNRKIFGSLRTYHLPSHSTAFWRPGYWGRQIFWLVRLSGRVSVVHTSLSHQQCYGRKKKHIFTFSDFFSTSTECRPFFATFNFCFKLAWHKDEVDLHGNKHVWTHFHPKVPPPEEHLRQILGLSLNNAYIETGYFPREKIWHTGRLLNLSRGFIKLAYQASKILTFWKSLSETALQFKAKLYYVEGYSRHQVTAAVTEQYKSCLKLTAIKQACLLQTWQPSFRAVIRAKRLKKLPKMYNKSFLITQPCSERFERKKVMICYVKRPCLSLNAFFPYPLWRTPKNNLKNPHKTSTPTS